MLTREKLLELLEQHGLSHRADEILSHCKPSVHLSLQYGVDEADIPVGASKMGGSPDVPTDFVWPQWNGIPLTFIAQFRLSDVKPYDVENLLPERGMLYFFFEAWSYHKSLRETHQKLNGAFKVVFYENEAALKRISHPVALTSELDDDGNEIPLHPYHACLVELEPELTLPSIETNEQLVQILGTDKEIYWQWYDDSYGYIAKPMHRLLGDENDIQYNWCLREDAVRDWRLGDIGDWMLLLQVDGDVTPYNQPNHPGFFYWQHDTSVVYFCINKKDLLERNFERVWLDMISL